MILHVHDEGCDQRADEAEGSHAPTMDQSPIDVSIQVVT